MAHRRRYVAKEGKGSNVPAERTLSTEIELVRIKELGAICLAAQMADKGDTGKTL